MRLNPFKKPLTPEEQKRQDFLDRALDDLKMRQSYDGAGVPRLVLRLEDYPDYERDEPLPDVFDSYFRCAYMGAAEYEWGAIPASLREIHRMGKVKAFPVPISDDEGMSRLVYIVCQAGRLDECVAAVTGHLRGVRVTKEPSHFSSNFHGRASEYHQRTIAWWALDNFFGWTLDAEHADRLVAAFNAPEKKK